ncbi:hypothetical protein H9L13_07630 [Sphingomonas lutea]|uniref:Uncharacterized protein n=1 Tax=Sphingomonas lutea TaxID=1045317 RepID=A0A7G9SFF8_9SPHN|nr:hypothetical protein [Sphingomonas lutea]QNN66583.1 hypothetical protein H9L13_07630 [Sphingomonas lutea]
MTDNRTSNPAEQQSRGGTARQRAIDTYASARDSVSGAGRRAADTLGQAPLIALAGALPRAH